MSTARRIALTLAAYALSSLVTGYVVWASLFAGEVSDVGFRAPGFGLFITLLVAWFAAAPASATVLLAEAKGWRMPWYYAIAGALIGLALGGLFKTTWFFPWLGLGFGPVSSAIYWAIAGRRAGSEDPKERRATLIAMAIILLAATAITVPQFWSLRFF